VDGGEAVIRISRFLPMIDVVVATHRRENLRGDLEE
jgi:hypothetical protein